MFLRFSRFLQAGVREEEVLEGPALVAAGEKAEAFYLDEAKKEDAASVEVFRNANVEIADMTEEDFNEWLALAKETSFKAFVEELPDGQALLDMALSVE